MIRPVFGPPFGPASNKVARRVDITVNAVIMPADAVDRGRVLAQDLPAAHIAAKLAKRIEKSAAPQNRIAAPPFMNRE